MPLRLPALGLLLLSLVSTSCSPKESNSPAAAMPESAGTASPSPNSTTGKKEKGPRRVHVHELQPRRVEERLPATSHIEAWRQVAVVSRVQAQVQEVLAIEGAHVQQGQVLVQLDDRQAKLEVAAARAQEDEITDLEREARIGLDEAKQRLELAIKDLAKAKNDRDRSRAQAEEELVSASQLEADELAYERAANEVELQHIGVRKAELGVQKLATQKRSAEIQRKIKERILEDYTIEAPFDGTVARSLLKGGEWTAPQASLLELTDRRRLVVYFARPQQEFGRIRTGQSVELEVDAFPGEVFRGELAFIAPLVDQQTGTFRARAELTDPEGKLRAGMFTRAEIITAVSERALMVPRTGIFYDGDEPFAFVARDGKAVRVAIAPGIATKSAIEASNLRTAPDSVGFQPGDLVIVVGGEDLEPGQAVQVTGRRGADGQLLAETGEESRAARGRQDG